MSGTKSQSLVASTGGGAGVGLKPGSCNDSMWLLEWRSGKTLSMTHVQPSWSIGWLELWFLIAHRAEVPLISMSRWSPYLSVQTYGFGCSSPHKGVPVTPHYLSLDIALDVTIMADSDSILHCQKCPKSLLSSCSLHPGKVVSGLWQLATWLIVLTVNSNSPYDVDVSSSLRWLIQTWKDRAW